METPNRLDKPASSSKQPLIVCHECDLLQRQPHSVHECRVLCHRCGAILMRHIPNSIDRVIALSLAGLILLVVANVFPFLSFQLGNQVSQTTLFTGVYELYKQGLYGLSGLVFFTSILAPFLQLTLMLYIFIPLRFGHAAVYYRPAYRLLHAIKNWNMIEVFMIGILVALVKLVKMAHIVPGIALWSFMALIFLVTGAAWSIDGRILWNQLKHSQ